MSSATKPTTGSLSSVWDTLNAIKARQKAAEAAAPSGKATPTRRSGGEPAAARKRLLELFEKRVSAAAAARNTAQDGSDASTTAKKAAQFETPSDSAAPPRTPASAEESGATATTASKHPTDPPAQTAAQLLRAFDQDCRDDEQVAKLREMYVARAKTDANAQLSTVRRLLKEGEDSVVVAKHALRGAQRVAKGLVGVADGR